MDLLLKNITWVNDNGIITADVRISHGIISEIGSGLVPSKKEKSIDLQNHFLYPGLINAHDHLEMNLYPRLGNPPYNNYTEWMRDIYKPKESPVKEIESVDIKDRLLWGGIKNLISGATTVIHHNPWHRIFSREKFPVRVWRTDWAHSLASEKDVKKKFPRNTIVRFIIHAAEGVDKFAQAEIPKLNQLGLLKENTVLIHAVAVNEESKKLIEQAKASVVWCPSSNLFMFGKTSPVDQLREKILVALGSDSTMTGLATLLEEMCVAKNTGLATAKEIFEMSTSVPAKIFHLEKPEIKIGSRADLWIAPMLHTDYFENILLTKPSGLTAVFFGGELRYGSNSFAKETKDKGFSVNVQGDEKWFFIDILSLKKRIESKAKDQCRQNALWKLLFNE